MNDEDEFETYFRRASGKAPVKQLSQQYSPITRTPTTTTRRASLQAPDVIFSTQSASSSKRSSPITPIMSPRNASPTSDVHDATTPTSPNPYSSRRRSRRESSSSTSKTSAWLARHFDQWPSSPGGSGSRTPSGQHRRGAQLVSFASSPAAVHAAQSGISSPVGVGPSSTTSRHGRRATLAGDLLQIPPSFTDCAEDADRRSSSVSPPRSGRKLSPGARQTQSTRAARRAMGSDQLWEQADSESQEGSATGAASHMVRTFRLSAKGVVNVGNAVRSDKVPLEGEGDAAVHGPRTGRAERPTALRNPTGARRRSSLAVSNHSPRRSPQRAAAAPLCGAGDVYADQSPGKLRLEQPEYKVLVVGDHGVGKTELIRHFTSSYAEYAASAGQCRSLYSVDP